MTFLRENWFKLGIILVLLIIGFSVASYLSERNSYYRLQTAQETEDRLVKEQNEKRDYIAKRKKECFDIYDKEKANWNNTRRPEYNEEEDVCRIIYKAQQGEWANVNCKKFTPASTTPAFSALWNYLVRQESLCEAGEFEREF